MMTRPNRRQQRPEQHEAGAHLGRRLERHEQPLDVARGDLVDVVGRVVDDDAEVAQRLGHDPHVLDLGDVGEPAALAGQGRGREQLERRVLRAADRRPCPCSGCRPDDPEDLAGDRLGLVLPVERPSVSHGHANARAPWQSRPAIRCSSHQPRCRGPSRWRRSATRIRRSACWSCARAADRSTASVGQRPRARARPRGGPPGPSRGRSRWPGRPSRPSRRPCPAEPAGSRRRSRTTPPSRPSGCAARPTPSIDTSGAWCGSTPSSPSTPGQLRPNRPRPSRPAAPGVTISSRSGIAVSPPASRRSRGRRRSCPARKKACSGSVSVLPSRISLNDATVSLIVDVLARTGR